MTCEYTPPSALAANFSLQEYTPPSALSADFELCPTAPAGGSPLKLLRGL